MIISKKIASLKATFQKKKQ